MQLGSTHSPPIGILKQIKYFIPDVNTVIGQSNALIKCNTESVSHLVTLSRYLMCPRPWHATNAIFYTEQWLSSVHHNYTT